MQGYKAQLTDLEIAALATYERNAWGNNTGSIVQPSEVKPLR
jgi:cytochrome c oxidase subunit 2